MNSRLIDHGPCEVTPGCTRPAIFRLNTGKSCKECKPQAVVFAPFLGQQEKFFARRERVVFFGGAVAGGKSVCLMMKFAQQLAVEKRRFAEAKKRGQVHMSRAWGIYFRRTTPDLKQIKMKSREYFPAFDRAARFNDNDGIWTFPNAGNAVFQFAHMEHDKDRFKYKSNEYCTAEGTRVLMADGSFMAIESIQGGDFVMTLEGPRMVTATYDTGVKPCVEMTIGYQGETVGTQVHPTTHPVLVLPREQCVFVGSPDKSGIASLVRLHEAKWLDFESHLGGLRESPVTRVSKVGQDNCYEASDGSRLELMRLPALNVPVVLHAPTLRRALVRIQSREGSGQHERSLDEFQVRRSQEEVSSLGSLPSPIVAHERTGYTEGTPVFYDGEGVTNDLGTQKGCQVHCSTCTCPRDESLPTAEGPDPNTAPPRADAGTRTHSGSPPESQAGIQGRSHETSSSYRHFYSGDRRLAQEEVLWGEASISYVGRRQTYDLTVEGANHYITELGLVNTQTLILFDELTEFLESQYDYMDTRLRTTDPFLEPYLQVCSGSNPDGEGLIWVRERFIEVAPPETIVRIETKLRDGRLMSYDQIFIPAKLEDNPLMMESGQYEASLMNKRPEVREALLNGNWYIVSGAYLSNVWDSNEHVCEDHDVPDGASIFRSGDFGVRQPTSIGWWYMDRDGGLTMFAHLRCTGLTSDQVADKVAAVETRLDLWNEEGSHSSLNFARNPLDSACFGHGSTSGAPSVAKDFARKGIRWKPAKKGPGSRFNGAAQIVRRLTTRIPAAFEGAESPTERERPMLRFMRNCVSPIKTIPVLRADPNDAEDVDTKGDDHDWDMVMYACLENPIKAMKEDDDFDDEDLPEPSRTPRRFEIGPPIR